MGLSAGCDRVVCNISDLDDQHELFSIGAGSLFLGSLKSRPCVFVTTTSMLGWIEPGSGSQLAPSEVVAYAFSTELARDEHVRHEGWDRVVDGYLKGEMWELFQSSGSGQASREAFEMAYVDALDAVRQLPCGACGTVAWPTITKPARGSAEWWDDPSAEFSCRECGRYLADPFAYPVIRQPTARYPHEGVVDRARLDDST